MTNLRCARCGQVNRSGAVVCGGCDAPLRLQGEAESPRRDTFGLPPGPSTGEGQTPGAGDLQLGDLTPGFNTVGDVLKPTLRLYRDNFPLVAKIVLAPAVPLVLLQYYIPQSPPGLASWAGGGFFNACITALIGAALTSAVLVFLRTGANPKMGESFGRVFPATWFKVLVCNILFTIITTIGFVLLIIPGIVLSLMYALVVPVAVLEDRSIWETFQRSASLTEGYRWRIFGTQFLLGLIIFIASLLVTGGSFLGGGGTQSFLTAVIAALSIQLLSSSFTVLTLFIYLGILADGRRAQIYGPGAVLTLVNRERTDLPDGRGWR